MEQDGRFGQASLAPGGGGCAVVDGAVLFFVGLVQRTPNRFSLPLNKHLAPPL